MSITFDILAGNRSHGLVGYWKMDEGAGNTLFDSSRYGNHMALNGHGWESGRNSKTCIRFSGGTLSSGIRGGELCTNLSPTGGMTLLVWTKGPYSASYKYIFGKEDYNTDRNGFVFLVGTTSGAYTWEVANNTTRQLVSNAFPGTINHLEWTHVGFGWDGSNYKVYKNGKLVGITGQTMSPTYVNHPITIGRNQATAADSFNGNLQSLRFYNRSLSDAEVSGIYQDENT
jgi:hypothetical protein